MKNGTARDEGRQAKGETNRKVLKSMGESGADEIESYGRTTTTTTKRLRKGKQQGRNSRKGKLTKVN
jgi:hypothetical protein